MTALLKGVANVAAKRKLVNQRCSIWQGEIHLSNEAIFPVSTINVSIQEVLTRHGA